MFCTMYFKLFRNNFIVISGHDIGGLTKKPASFQTQASRFLLFKILLLVLNSESHEQNLSEYDMRRTKQLHQ